jgi:hypothetical protein
MTLSPDWLVAAAAIAAALPIAAIATRHLAWRHARRRAQTEWWRP